MTPVVTARTGADSETQRVLRDLEIVPLPPPLLHADADALYDKGVGIDRLSDQLPVTTFVQPAAVSQFSQLPPQRLQPSPQRLALTRAERAHAGSGNPLGLPAASTSTSAQQPKGQQRVSKCLIGPGHRCQHLRPSPTPREHPPTGTAEPPRRSGEGAQRRPRGMPSQTAIRPGQRTRPRGFRATGGSSGAGRRVPS